MRIFGNTNCCIFGIGSIRHNISYYGDYAFNYNHILFSTIMHTLQYNVFVKKNFYHFRILLSLIRICVLLKGRIRILFFTEVGFGSTILFLTNKYFCYFFYSYFLFYKPKKRKNIHFYMQLWNRLLDLFKAFS